MRMRIAFACAVSLLAAVAVTSAGCGGSSAEAEEKVAEALRLIEGSQPCLEDLLELDSRFNALGTRSANVDDTIAEGKSLAELAMLDVDELESAYTRAGELLDEAAAAEGSGPYGEYARLALAAVDEELEAFAVNRRLLKSVWDMLDVLPMAEREEQLSYYVEEIGRLTEEVSALLDEAASAAAEADRYRKEHGL